jgi:ubiquinone/menaquinone biosynthesis C-methylase UbiE
MEELKQNIDLQNQRLSVISLYDGVAERYDSEFEGKAEYQVPGILRDVYLKNNITSGEVLDIGCGTGKIKEYLGEGFTYSGIDISPAMIQQAEKRGVHGYVGPVEEVIKTFGDKSVDHITALSSLYFIKDFNNLIQEFKRVARRSIFITLEQFEPKIIDMMKERGVQLYNHPSSVIENPDEIINNAYLWKRPNTEDRIFGDIVFKKF